MSVATLGDAAAVTEVPVCQVDELAPGLGRTFEVSGRSVAVFLTRAGTVHAVANTCPHRGGPLADGMLAGGRVVCPFHAFRFDLTGGDCDQPGVCAIDVFPARVHDGWVVLTMPSAARTS